jgi:acyl dehydratase
MDVEEARTDRPRVGQTASRSRLVTGRDIELFTEISGDRNPLHQHPSAPAASSPARWR